MAWWSDMLPNLIRHEIARYVNRFARQRFLIVTSYNPNDHTVKGNFMPDQTESGWIPIRVSGASQGGISRATGPSIGDQAIVHHAEEDSEVGHVSGWIHNDVDRPPNVPSGTDYVGHNPSGNLRKLNSKGFRYVVPGGAHSVVVDQHSQHRVQTNGWNVFVVGDLTKFTVQDSTGAWWTPQWVPGVAPPTDPTA